MCTTVKVLCSIGIAAAVFGLIIGFVCFSIAFPNIAATIFGTCFAVGIFGALVGAIYMIFFEDM